MTPHTHPAPASLPADVDAPGSGAVYGANPHRPVASLNGFRPPAAGQGNCTPSIYALVAFVAVEAAFVLGLLMITRCSRWEAVQTAAAMTAVALTCFYARNAVVTIGRRLIASGSNDLR